MCQRSSEWLLRSGKKRNYGRLTEGTLHAMLVAMARLLFHTLLAGLALVCGCSDADDDAPGDVGRGGTGFGGAGGAPVMNVTEAGSGGHGGEANLVEIFTSESEAITVSWFNFFAGGYRFARKREQLSPEQLDLVEAIKVVSSTDDCWEDAAEVSVVVTAGDTNRTYSANEYAGNCGRDVTLVDFQAVSALLDTVQCLSAKGYDASSPEASPTIVPDDGCWHGLFNATGESPAWWFRLEIPAAGEYAISLDRCGKRELVLDLFESDAETELTSASSDGECPVLTHTFADAGSYALRVEMQSGTQAGDFFLSLQSTSGQ